MNASENPYVVTNDKVLEPPVHWWERLKFLGPGLILTASIVGSGELITTTLLGAFGITGIGGDEIMAYNYWLIEKGYASHTGPRQDSEAWRRRAAGWMRVMQWDAMVSMCVYTLVTVVFYLLGAAVLHRQGLVPKSEELIKTLSFMYTESLGAWAAARSLTWM